MLSDWAIRSALASGKLRIDPYPNDEQIQPASIDLTLSANAISFRKNGPVDFLDPSIPLQYDEKVFWNIPPLRGRHYFFLDPHEFMLGSVEQHIELSNDICGFLHGRSSLARYGLFIHVTAGLCDPGWNGRATLELFNANKEYPIRLWSGMSIATMTFTAMSGPVIRPYGHKSRRSKYQGAQTVQVSKYYTEVE